MLLCRVSQSLVIGMCRLFHGPIHNSSSDNVWLPSDSGVSFFFFWWSTEDSCSSLTHEPLLFLLIMALAILVLDPKPFRSVMVDPKEPQEDKVFRFTSLEGTPIPFSVLFSELSTLITEGGSS